MCQSPEVDCVHFSGRESLAARCIGLRPELLYVSVCLQGKQIKDESHFRGCKNAPGDRSGVSDTPNPPRAASTYRLPIHVSSKWTLRTSSIIKCSRNKPCYLFRQPQKERFDTHHNWIYFYSKERWVSVGIKWPVRFLIVFKVLKQPKCSSAETGSLRSLPAMTLLTLHCNSNTNRVYRFIIHISISAFSALSYGIFVFSF